MCDFATANFEAIEIPVAANQATVNVPDQPQLRGKQIVAVEVLTPAVAPASPLTFQTAMPAADLANCTLELWNGNNIFFRRSPLLMLNRVQDSSNTPFVRQLPQFRPVEISWTKSQLVFGTAPAAAGVVSLGVYYL